MISTRSARFASNVSVVTFEFENVPAATAQAAAERALVRPAGLVLHTTQNRLREKTFLAQTRLPRDPLPRRPVASRTCAPRFGNWALLRC